MHPPQTKTPTAIEDQRRFWNSWNEKFREKNGRLPEVNSRQASMVVEWIAGLGEKELEILEVGCGSGWLCQQLVVFGKVTGTDLSNEVLDRAKAALTNVVFIAGDFNELDFHSSHFDVVVSLEVLAHIADQHAFVEKIARLLRPGGYLMLATQNRFVLERYSGVAPKGAGQIRNWVDAKTLRGLLREHFAIVNLTSIVPMGDRGILRWTNAIKVNRILSIIASPVRIEAMKERLFLGHTLMVLARKLTDSR